MRCLALLGTLNGPHALDKERERESERERDRERERENSRYSGMAGKDASRAMSTGNFKQDATPSLHGLLGAPRSALVAAFYLLEPPYDLRRNQACSKSEVFQRASCGRHAVALLLPQARAVSLRGLPSRLIHPTPLNPPLLSC